MKKLALLARIDYQRDITKLHKKLLQKIEVANFFQVFSKGRRPELTPAAAKKQKRGEMKKTCLACGIIVTERYYKISREFITKE